MQLDLFALRIKRPDLNSDISLTCQSPDFTDAENEYSGFPKGFDGHDWCARYRPRWLLAGGMEVPCACSCHRSDKMLKENNKS